MLQHGVTPPRLRVLQIPRHACNHCSACCSSYAVGPLLPDDLTRVQASLPAVRAAFPDQSLDEVIVVREHRGKEASFLAKRDGYCTFWRSDVGCSIHSAVGGEAKPLVCQLFPLQLISDESGLRMGVRPTCLSHHASFDDGPEIPGDFIQRLATLPESFLERSEVQGEELALRLLSVPDLDTGSILSFLAGRARDDVPSLDSWLESRLHDLLAEIDTLGPVGPVHPRTSTAQRIAAFRSWLESRPPAEAGAWPEVRPEGLPYLRDALSRLVFLRQTTLHPSLAWALVAYVAAARWASAWAHADESSWSSERFGSGFSTWLILLENPRLQRALFREPPPLGPRESEATLGGRSTP